MAGGFDVAVANHVLEHSYEPPKLIAQLRELVRPGGHVLIATPNLRGAAMRWKTWVSRLGLKARPFRHLDYPKHLVLFDIRNLPRLVEEAGLSVVSVETYTRASSDAAANPPPVSCSGTASAGATTCTYWRAAPLRNPLTPLVQPN